MFKEAFIIGTGRCGTTWLAQMLNTHPRIVVPPELHSINRVLKENVTDFVKCFYEDQPTPMEDFINREELKSFIKDKPIINLFEYFRYKFKKEIMIEQTPYSWDYYKGLNNIFPNSLWIHVIRDPRGVITSYAKTRWPAIPSKLIFKDKKSFEQGLVWWKDIILHIRNLNIPNYIEIKYEDLVLNTDIEINKLYNKLGVEIDLNYKDKTKFYDYFGKLPRNVNYTQASSVAYNKWLKSPSNNISFKDSLYNYHELFKDINIPLGVKQLMNSLGYKI